MNNNDRENIHEVIRELGGKRDYEVFTAKVKSVDEDARLMEVEDEDVTYSNVRLQSVSDGTTGIVIIPEVGSFVTVGKLKNMQQYVMLQANKAKKVIIDCDEVVYNKGENEGLVKVKELTKKLNALEKLLNSTISKFNTHTHTSACTAGGSTTLPTTTLQTEVISATTQQADIENKKIKH